MIQSDYEKCARRIAGALQLEPGEKVVIKLDPRVFMPLVPPLQNVIRASGAHISGVILAEDTNAASDRELASFRQLFKGSDVFISLSQRRQGSRRALARALIEGLAAR